MARWNRKDFESYCANHGENPHDAFHTKFWSTLVDYEETLRLKHKGRRVRAARTWVSIQKKGPIKTTIAHVLAAKPTKGFFDLIEAGRPENTDEYILLRFEDQIPFGKQAIEAAKARLAAYGVSPPIPQTKSG